jgi:hypothetical protein
MVTKYSICCRPELRRRVKPGAKPALSSDD